jgi:predicted DNA-binding antitoxin AbrB/MazE fold protein
MMRQTIKARCHDGVLQPLEPLALADDAEVQVTVDTEMAVSGRGNFAACRTGLPEAHRRRHRTCGGHRLGPAALLRYKSNQVTRRRGGP